MDLQIGYLTPASEPGYIMPFTSFDGSAGYELMSNPDFVSQLEMYKSRIANGEISNDNTPAEKLAKVMTEAHLAMADYKRGWVNLKYYAEKKDWDNYRLQVSRMKLGIASLQTMIKKTL